MSGNGRSSGGGASLICAPYPRSVPPGRWVFGLHESAVDDPGSDHRQRGRGAAHPRAAGRRVERRPAVRAAVDRPVHPARRADHRAGVHQHGRRAEGAHHPGGGPRRGARRAGRLPRRHAGHRGHATSRRSSTRSRRWRPTCPWRSTSSTTTATACVRRPTSVWSTSPRRCARCSPRPRSTCATCSRRSAGSSPRRVARSAHGRRVADRDR